MAEINLTSDDIAALGKLAQHEAANLALKTGMTTEQAMQSMAMTLDSVINRASVPNSSLYGTTPSQINNYGSVVQSVMSAPNQYSGFNLNSAPPASPGVQSLVDAYVGLRDQGMPPVGFQKDMTPLAPGQTPTLGTHYANLEISSPDWGKALQDPVQFGSGLVQHIGGWLSTDPRPKTTPTINAPQDQNLLGNAPLGVLQAAEQYSPGTLSKIGYDALPGAMPEQVNPAISVGSYTGLIDPTQTASMPMSLNPPTSLADLSVTAPLGAVETAPLTDVDMGPMAQGPQTPAAQDRLRAAIATLNAPQATPQSRINATFGTLAPQGVPVGEVQTASLNPITAAPTIQSPQTLPDQIDPSLATQGITTPTSMRGFAPTVEAPSAVPTDIDPAIASQGITTPTSMRGFAQQSPITTSQRLEAAFGPFSGTPTAPSVPGITPDTTTIADISPTTANVPAIASMPSVASVVDAVTPETTPVQVADVPAAPQIASVEPVVPTVTAPTVQAPAPTAPGPSPVQTAVTQAVQQAVTAPTRTAPTVQAPSAPAQTVSPSAPFGSLSPSTPSTPMGTGVTALGGPSPYGSSGTVGAPSATGAFGGIGPAGGVGFSAPAGGWGSWGGSPSSFGEAGQLSSLGSSMTGAIGTSGPTGTIGTSTGSSLGGSLASGGWGGGGGYSGGYGSDGGGDSLGGDGGSMGGGGVGDSGKAGGGPTGGDADAR